MNDVALITDSTCDIPAELLAQYQITVVPSLVLWGDEQFRDRVDLTPEDFYARLASDPVMPTTSHPRPDEFAQLYQDAIDGGAQEVVVITVSSAMSGTFEAACQGAELVGGPVRVIDALGPTMSLGWQVLAAARAREAGGDGAAMEAAAGQVRAGLVQYVMPDTLKYLARGGRIGHATSWVGTLLNIKPIVYIDHTTGLVEPGRRARTRKKAIEALYEEFFGQLDTSRPLRVAVLHSGRPADAARLVARIESEYHPVELLSNITGPVLGIHTGPDALALVGYSEA